MEGADRFMLWALVLVFVALLLGFVVAAVAG
jgi:hypothetical protein